MNLSAAYEHNFGLPHTRMQIGKQRSHLFFGKPPLKPWHLAFAEEYLPPDLGVRRGNSAGQLCFHQHAVDIGRSRLQGQIIFFMAMGTSDGVKMLPLSLLQRQFSLPFAAGDTQCNSGKQGQRGQRRQSRLDTLTLPKSSLPAQQLG